MQQTNEVGSIYIEGTDLVGKDAVGSTIEGKYGITNIQKLTLHNNNPWDADRTKELPLGHPLFPAFLVRSIIWDIQNYNPRLEKDRLQISFTASRSAAWTQTSRGDLADIYSELLKFSPLFQNSFLLWADIEVKRERLKKRALEGGETTTIDNLVFTKPEFVKQMDEHLKEIASRDMGATIIDTSDKSIDQIGDIIVATIDGQLVYITRNDKRVKQLDITPELLRFHKELLLYSKKVIRSKGLSESFYDKMLLPIQNIQMGH